MIRAQLRRLRHALDGAVHASRRRSLLALLGQWRPPPKHVLFICYGNICRSPYAAAALEQAGPQEPGLRVSSAGLFGPGRPPPDQALRAAARRSIDLSAHRSRLVTGDLLRQADVIFVMELRQRAELGERIGDGSAESRCFVLGDLDPQPIETRGIPDPYGRSAAFFDATLDRIDRCVTELAQALGDGPRT